ncbi:tudor domain-containing protein 1 isoform X2 [Syngnathoides biaculeatus]|uniref:tudor domain-containing protein 1 isoform X2 n=1 Tax=Syngnathoides biaculeatus TaxID=300417 RepID=UPI002ADDDE68|nr:tudor domain-containing protein 1 isoform X2 [Syngnathoides biaculeatus]
MVLSLRMRSEWSFYNHVRSDLTKNPIFRCAQRGPNMPLRKQLTLPVVCRFPDVVMSPDRPAMLTALSHGAGPASPPASRVKPAELGAVASPVPLCHFCGKQGNLRCACCKKSTYCSAGCQASDWKRHKQMCVPVKMEGIKEKPNQIAASLSVLNSIPLGSKAVALEPPRVYLKDLHPIKINKGTDIQASVVEFYNPGRFFLLFQSPEFLDILQRISNQLQKIPSSRSSPPYVPRVGEVCTAQFSGDLIWYRCLVQKLAADQSTARMLYIDYGNEEDVPMDRIGPLPADLEPYHPCALECHVAGVELPEGNWSTECCSAMKRILADRVLTVRLVETLDNVHGQAVDIELPMGKCLSSFLIERGFLKRKDSSPTVQEICGMEDASLENFKRQSQGKDDNKWAQPPEPLLQAVGNSFSVVVTHFQSPDNMIVQKVENAGVIQELQVNLRQHCSQVSASQNFIPAPGTICCAQYSEDKQWYRAKVLAYSSEKRVCVGYIDFGNSEYVNIDCLRPINSSLLASPMQALPCCLAGIQPVGKSWPEKCLLVLQRRLSNRILLVRIEGAHEGKALVTMVDEDSDPQANVAEMLISAGFATPALVPVKANEVSQAEQPAPKPHPPLPVCKPLSWSSVELTTDGHPVALLSVFVNNPGEFFCRIDNPAVNQRMVELNAEVKQHCEAEAIAFEPKVGEPCCAMSPDDRVWYRAMVKSQSEDMVAVNFVDCGYNLEVERRNLRSIKSQLLRLPFQAVRCFLSGVEPVGSEWSKEAIFWFQKQVGGEKLSARVFSVSKRGYGVELECRGRSIAAGLVSSLLARCPGEILQKALPGSSPGGEQRASIRETEQSQIKPSEQMTVVKELPSGTAFPVDWKTVEMSITGPFKPYIAAVISPSLFYLLSLTKVDQQKLQEMMLELATFCNGNRATLSSCTDRRKLSPGAACCAQFTADNNWYRAVVVELCDDNEVSVIYADYGNTEKLSVSRILPIPEHLLQLPFTIARCALAGKEHFPAEWPPDMLQIFYSLLQDGILATVLSFDSFANILTITLPAEKGGVNLSALIKDALESSNVQSARSQSAATEAEQLEGSSALLPKLTPAVQKSLENTVEAPGPAVNLEQTSHNPQQIKTTPAELQRNSQTPACCCQSLETKIDRLEQMIARIEQMMELLVSSRE